jgi:hypothetical protein
MERQHNSLPYRQGFIQQCYELAIGQLERNSIALTSIEKAELENFIRVALMNKTDDYVLRHEHVYTERLVLLVDMAAVRLRISNQPMDEILESLIPWHPWY